MSSRKIFNYESSVLIDETIQEYGHHPDTLGKSSAKFIIAVCRFCGKPSHIRKGFYNKSGSACHKECKIQEMKLQKSPFLDASIREKAKQTNLERYGVQYASQNSSVAEKISSSKFRKCVDQKKLYLREIQDAVDADFVEYGDFDLFVPKSRFAICMNISKKCCELNNKDHNLLRHKLDLARASSVRLFNLFELQWRNRKPQILNFIRSILGGNSKNIAARKCVVTNDSAQGFMNENHIQGYGNGTIKFFNLVCPGDDFLGDRIVASMTASGHHRQNIEGNPVILNRLCFKDNHNVQGGATKLFKYFKEWAKNEGYDRILSWSDNIFTEGHIYGILGFDKVDEYGPDYFYWDIANDRYVSKQSQKKSNTGCPVDITERDWCYERGLYRLYDCGKKKWEVRL